MNVGFGSWLDKMLNAQVRGLGLVALMSVLVLAFGLRSIRAGVFALLPNSLPVLLFLALLARPGAHFDSDYLLVCVVIVSFGGVVARAQQTFELQVPGTTVRSRADLSGQTLRITDSQGQTFAYVRERDFDTADGAYLGYYNLALKKALRWPTSGRRRH